ncbi:MAG: hypothetical protein K0R39_3119 [Symbiobacteriaceae bacterium]|jgi:uncharacterized membrane protein YhiD involved in acid resistance|nr:hypothetical protein [Symbiobacteriaceae bacterium]
MNGALNFTDLFKKSFLTTATQDLTLGRILIGLGLAFLIGIFIYFVYKRTFKGVMYSRTFATSLIAITMVTSLVIMAVTSNVVLSLGMVGALSITRFRTAVKDPMDLVFLFWAIAIGIVTGAGLYMLALLGTVIIGLVLFLLSRAPASETPYLLVIHALDDQADEAVRAALRSGGKKIAVKSKTISISGVEATYELRLKDGGSSLVSEIAAIKGIESAVLIAYNGDYVA